VSEAETVIVNLSKTTSGFLDSLDDAKREKAVVAFEDEETRRTWYYTPRPRAGLPMGEMSPAQNQWVRRMLAASLSEAGYNHAALIIGLEYAVDYFQEFVDRTYGDLPGTRNRDQGNYRVAVFGRPGSDGPWGWTLGGHHLSLHYTVHGDSISVTPAFFGGEPARTPMPGGQVFRPLAAEEDTARRLLSLLSADQLDKATLSSIAATDIVQTNRPRVEKGALYEIGGPGPGGQKLRDELGLSPEDDEAYRYTVAPKGLRVVEMNKEQRDSLATLIEVYFSHMPDAIGKYYAWLLSPERFEGTAFAWGGSNDFGAAHYYRVQSDRLLIEYDCSQDGANHTHSVWRDPIGDFGEDILRRHKAREQAAL
jgi:hypothetical protein